MQKEPEFLMDDFLEEQQQELERNREEMQELIKQLKNPKHQTQINFFKSFVSAMIHSRKQEKPKQLPEPLRKIFQHKHRRPLFRPRPVQRQIQKPVQRPLPAKHQTITPIKKLAVKIQQLQQPIKKDLIIDKFTQNVLATANIASKYNVKEPDLDENDILTLKKIIDKRPKTIKKAWKFIQKFGKKFKIQQGHEENLKYYIINRFFALGKLEPLMHDQDITKITCNGVGKPIVVTHKAKELPTNISFKDVNQLTTFLNILSERTKQKIDKKHPTLDATYRNFRIHVTFGIEPGNSKFTFERIE